MRKTLVVRLQYGLESKGAALSTCVQVPKGQKCSSSYSAPLSRFNCFTTETNVVVINLHMGTNHSNSCVQRSNVPGLDESKET